jgi:DNA polymerase I
MNDVRSCFVARPGFYLCSVDYSQLELCTLAQVVYDAGCGSVLRDAINSGRDLHLDLACSLRGWDYHGAKARKKEEPYASGRQAAKAANFGYPGGLGVRRFVAYAWQSYGVRMTESESRSIQRAWRERWPDVAEWQRRCGAAIDQYGSLGVKLDRTGFERGGCKYTEACNTQFQGLAAAGAKAALWNVVRGANSIYPVAFVHDEIIAEVPIETAHENAESLARIMIESMRVYTPDVTITAEPALMERWYKGAETVRDAQGRLQPWYPPQKASAA